MSDRSQEALDGEAVTASAQQASTDQAQSVELPVLTPLQPVLGYSQPHEQAQVLPVPAKPVYKAGQFIQNIGTATSTTSSTTLTFTIPDGKAPQRGNTVVIAGTNTYGASGSTLATVTDSRGGNTWLDVESFAWSATAPSASLAIGQIADLRDGDVLTFTYTAAADKKAVVIAEFAGIGQTDGGDFVYAGATTSVVGPFQTFVNTLDTIYFISVAYAGTQSLPTPPATGGGFDSETGTWFTWHGRAAAGAHAVDLYSIQGIQATRVFHATLPVSAEWSVVGYSYARTYK